MTATLKSAPAQGPNRDIEQTDSVVPVLVLCNAQLAIGFYKNAFGAIHNEHAEFLDGNGRVEHAEIIIGQTKIIVVDEAPELGVRSPHDFGGSAAALKLYVNDVDAAFDRALKSGATALIPVQDKFYGERVGQLLDPFGYRWVVATRTQKLSVDEIRRRSINRIWIDTLRKDIRTDGTLELVLRSMMSKPEHVPLVRELTVHLREIVGDENFRNIYHNTHKYLTKSIESAEPARKALLISALNSTHIHYAQTTESEFAYNVSSKPNENAVYFPNPRQGRPLFAELPFAKNQPLIDENTVVVSHGPSWVKSIANSLGKASAAQAAGCEFQTTLEFSQGLEYASGLISPPRVVLRKKRDGEVFLHPLAPEREFDSAHACATHVSQQFESMKVRLSGADVLLVTFNTSTVTQALPNSHVWPAKTAAFLPPLLSRHHILSVEENVAHLERSLEVLQIFNPSLKLIVAVAPEVPMDAVSQEPCENIYDVTQQKATLRVALDEFVNRNSGVCFYFPAFDTVMHSTAKPMSEDLVNLSEESEQKLIELFRKMFCAPPAVPSLNARRGS